MLAITQTKPHMRRPHVQIKEPFKYKTEVLQVLFSIAAVGGIELFNYTMYLLKFVYHVIP